MLKSYGVEGFRAHIRKSIGLGERFRRYIEADEVFEVLFKPRLSLTVFRLGGTGDLNSLNKKFYNNLDVHSDKLSLTHTVVNGVYCVRFVTGCPQTREVHVDDAYKIISDVARLTLSNEL